MKIAIPPLTQFPRRGPANNLRPAGAHKDRRRPARHAKRVALAKAIARGDF